MKRIFLILFLCLSTVSLTMASVVSTGEKAKSENPTSGNEVKNEVVAQDDKEDVGLAESDSTINFNTSCKFNFLFYFIYKMKYDEEDMELNLNHEL